MVSVMLARKWEALAVAFSAQWDFFTPEPVLYHARATGFELFGAGHVLSLALSLAVVALSLGLYLSAPAPIDDGTSLHRRRILLVMAGIPVILLTLKCSLYVALGLFEPLFWPLHTCNLCGLFALGYALAPDTSLGRRLADLLFCWGPIGCLGALLFPGWSWYCPAMTLASLCGFVEHALVLACTLCMTFGGDYAPSPRRVWFVLVVTIACGTLFRLANPRLGTNFFFVTNPAAVGGPFPWLVRTFGDPGFLMPYLLLALAFWAMTYGLYRLVPRLHKQQNG